MLFMRLSLGLSGMIRNRNDNIVDDVKAET